MPILMYHRIADDGPDSLVRWRVPPPDFARQIAWLAVEGFTSIGLDEWLTVHRRDPVALARGLVLTFDDAYADFVTTAWPILQRHGFGATMFVPTQFMGDVAEWDREFGEPAPLMPWLELDALVEAGLEIGAHTISHPRLTRLPTETEIVREVVGSRDHLAARYGRPVPTFAYPYGDYNETVARVVEDAGFRLAVTITPMSAGPFALGRLGVFGDEPFEKFVEKITNGREK
jgi:peptidoglycan/xylan/chitin deacetylase (PgdA/CDA1 family)